MFRVDALRVTGLAFFRRKNLILLFSSSRKKVQMLKVVSNSFVFSSN